MKCLIIASGAGSRLQTLGKIKPLVPLLDLPIIEHVILTAGKAGVSDFHVVVGYQGEKLRESLERIARKRNVTISYLVNNDWRKENGLSVLKAKEAINENFILLMSDHLFDESILAGMIALDIKNDEVVLAVDYKTKANKFVDEEDVTKVKVQRDRIRDIGKTLDDYNAYDTGIFLCSPAIFDALEESARKGDGSLSGGMRTLAAKGKARTFDIKDGWWIDIDDEKMFKLAEAALQGKLGKTSDAV